MVPPLQIRVQIQARKLQGDFPEQRLINGRGITR